MYSVNIINRKSAFASHLIDRLERIGVDTTDSQSTSIVCWPGDKTPACDIIIRPDGPSAYPNDFYCELVISDLFIPDGDTSWGPSEIDDCITKLISEEELGAGSPRYWVHVRDVVDVLSTILSKRLEGSYNIVGRRCWLHEEMVEELSNLFKRVKAAETKTFQLENLKISEPKVVAKEVPERPDIGPFHELCVEADLSGWYPLVPFRVGLMECIAHRLLE
ncbi:MAG: hypothetical protein H8D82_01340 [Euryarchaeota archaeon]|nr:hypothetical protein [Euryarchaeota archaeon]